MNGFLNRRLTLHVRHGLLMFTLLALALVATALSRPALPATVAVAMSAPTAPAVEQPTAQWPRAVLRLWILVPQLLPSHDR